MDITETTFELEAYPAFLSSLEDSAEAFHKGLQTACRAERDKV